MDKNQDIEKSIITNFRKKIWAKFVKAVTEYDMIQDGDKIAVCISGGKDSNLLAKCFQELKRHGKDNFDLEFGKIRYRSTGVAGGNNGLKSIDKVIGTPEYARIRVGTGNDELRKKMGDIDFVLSKFTPEEKTKLPEILAEIADKIAEIL